MGLSRRDSERVTELTRWLSGLDVGPGRPGPAEGVLPELRSLLRMEVAAAYGIEFSDSGFEVSFCHLAGPLPSKRVHAVLSSYVNQRSVRWGFFDPARPEPRQRNRAVSVGQSMDALPQLADGQIREVLARLGVAPHVAAQVASGFGEAQERLLEPLGLGRMHQLRALVCEGPALLAWVGGFAPARFSKREEDLLQRMVPALKKALRIQQLLERAPLHVAALIAALERIPAAAFLVSPRGTIQHANAAGRALLDAGEPGRRGELVQAVRQGGAAGYDVVPVTAAGQRTHHLLVRRERPGEARARAADAARAWGLTRRQTEVLGHLAQGTANRSIAAVLGCAVHTVELHVSAILEKADVESRAALIASLLER